MSQMRPPTGAAPVALAAVRRGSLADTVTYTGTGRRLQRAGHQPAHHGDALSLPVYPGDAVRAGQVVAQLDTSQVGAAGGPGGGAGAAGAARRAGRPPDPPPAPPGGARPGQGAGAGGAAGRLRRPGRGAGRPGRHRRRPGGSPERPGRRGLLEDGDRAREAARRRGRGVPAGVPERTGPGAGGPAALDPGPGQGEPGPGDGAGNAGENAGARRQVDVARAGVRMAQADIAVAQGQAIQAEAGAAAAQAAAREAAVARATRASRRPPTGSSRSAPSRRGHWCSPARSSCAWRRLTGCGCRRMSPWRTLRASMSDRPCEIAPGRRRDGHRGARHVRLPRRRPDAHGGRGGRHSEPRPPAPARRVRDHADHERRRCRTSYWSPRRRSSLRAGSPVWTAGGGRRHRRRQVYECVICHIHYTAAQAAKFHYRDPMEGGNSSRSKRRVLLRRRALTAHQVAVRPGRATGRGRK